MALQIRVKDHRACPVAICDVCGCEIAEAAKALYLWEQSTEFIAGEPVRLYLVHKGDCDRALTRTLRATEGTMELTVLPKYLANNLGVDDDEATELVASYEMFG